MLYFTKYSGLTLSLIIIFGGLYWISVKDKTNSFDSNIKLSCYHAEPLIHGQKYKKTNLIQIVGPPDKTDEKSAYVSNTFFPPGQENIQEIADDPGVWEKCVFKNLGKSSAYNIQARFTVNWVSAIKNINEYKAGLPIDEANYITYTLELSESPDEDYIYFLNGSNSFVAVTFSNVLTLTPSGQENKVTAKIAKETIYDDSFLLSPRSNIPISLLNKSH